MSAMTDLIFSLNHHSIKCTKARDSARILEGMEMRFDVFDKNGIVFERVRHTNT